jgi:hypothetical protein
MRRWRIHGNNIVSLLHGIALHSCTSPAEFKVYHNIIILYNIVEMHVSYPAFFLECENNNNII